MKKPPPGIRGLLPLGVIRKGFTIGSYFLDIIQIFECQSFFFINSIFFRFKKFLSQSKASFFISLLA
jgi:hypothetical protein